MSLKSVQDKITAAMANHYLSPAEAEDIVTEAKKDIGKPEFKDHVQAIKNLRNNLAIESWKFAWATDKYDDRAFRTLETFGIEAASTKAERYAGIAARFFGDVGSFGFSLRR